MTMPGTHRSGPAVEEASHGSAAVPDTDRCMPLVFTLGAMAEIFRLQGREEDALAELQKAKAYSPDLELPSSR